MWLYKGLEFKPEDCKDYTGFVYIITNLENGRQYVGKKLFNFTKRKSVKGRKKRVKSASDWTEYYGSSEELARDVATLGVSKFSREILHLCISKAHMTYMELREQMDRRVLESDQFYNGWIMARIRKPHLKKALQS